MLSKIKVWSRNHRTMLVILSMALASFMFVFVVIHSERLLGKEIESAIVDIDRLAITQPSVGIKTLTGSNYNKSGITVNFKTRNIDVADIALASSNCIFGNDYSAYSDTMLLRMDGDIPVLLRINSKYKSDMTYNKANKLYEYYKANDLKSEQPTEYITIRVLGSQDDISVFSLIDNNEPKFYRVTKDTENKVEDKDIQVDVIKTNASELISITDNTLDISMIDDLESIDIDTSVLYSIHNYSFNESLFIKNKLEEYAKDVNWYLNIDKSEVNEHKTFYTVTGNPISKKGDIDITRITTVQINKEYPYATSWVE